jgi:hypothetical protein
MEVSGQLHAPMLHLQEKSPLCLFDGKLGWPQNRSERYEEEKILCPCRELYPDSSAAQPVAHRK